MRGLGPVLRDASQCGGCGLQNRFWAPPRPSRTMSLGVTGIRVPAVVISWKEPPMFRRLAGNGGRSKPIHPGCAGRTG